jgi:hypothetical protein
MLAVAAALYVPAQVKAKVVRGYVDKMITLAKDGSLHARRQVRTAADGSRAAPVWQQQHSSSTAAAASPAAARIKVGGEPGQRGCQRVVMLVLVVHGVCSMGFLIVSASTLQRAGSCHRLVSIPPGGISYSLRGKSSGSKCRWEGIIDGVRRQFCQQVNQEAAWQNSSQLGCEYPAGACSLCRGCTDRTALISPLRFFPVLLHPALLHPRLSMQALAWIYDKELVANLFSGAAGELGDMGGGEREPSECRCKGGVEGESWCWCSWWAEGGTGGGRRRARRSGGGGLHQWGRCVRLCVLWGGLC